MAHTKSRGKHALRVRGYKRGFTNDEIRFDLQSSEYVRQKVMRDYSLPQKVRRDFLIGINAIIAARKEALGISHIQR